MKILFKLNEEFFDDGRSKEQVISHLEEIHNIIDRLEGKLREEDFSKFNSFDFDSACVSIANYFSKLSVVTPYSKREENSVCDDPLRCLFG